MKKLFLFAALMAAALMLFAQPTGSTGGKFTVASGVQVRFSQGNLQYHVRNHVWQFAVRQDSVIGKTNENRIEENYNGWIDLFGWGTSGYNDKMPYMYVRDNAAYGNGAMDVAGTNYDWGVYNAISNGGNKAGLWRTLTSAEWLYLLNNRQNAKLLHGFCSVNGLRGHIILPDNWSLPSGAHFTPTYADRAQNAYTLAEWTVLENAGAIFLPEAGYAYSNNSGIVTWSGPTSASNRGNIGPMTSDYITSTAKSSTSYYGVCLDGLSSFYNQDNNISTKPTSNDFYRENPVRLARTVEEFTVTFKNWDGTTLKSENVEYGFAATPPTDLVREGWTFTGWTASVSGMSKDYITDEVTFTAQYEKYITYTVTFVDGLTGDVIYTLTKTNGATLAISEYPTTPTHESNVFQGWFLPNGTTPVSTTLTVSSNMTLTARYTWDDSAGVLKAPMNESKNKFSVSADRQVLFSQGDLQYQPSTGKWQFAEDQKTRLTESENKKLTDASYTGWIDVFTWSNDEAVYGLTTSTAYPSSVGAFVDWGQNPIANGGNKTNTWRTLSNDEWTYLLSGRANAAELTFVANLSDGSYGIVILPDGWKDNVVCNSLLSDINYSANNTIDADDWSTFEAYGALFLPWGPFSFVYGSADSWGNSVYYWSRTYNDEASSLLSSPYAFMVKEGSSYKPETSYNKCSARFPVRLARYVQDCPEISSEFSASGVGCYTWDGKSYVASGDYRRIYSSVDGCDSIVTMHLTITQEQPVSGSGVLTGLFSVSADTQVRFSQGNLQYQSDTHSWRFAPEQFDVIGSIAISDGWEDLFGWSSTNSQFGLGTDFTGDFVDWGENAIANGGNRQNRWRTLTKAEWEYLSTGRPNAAQRKYSGKIEGRSGNILLPDEWTAPAGVTLTSGDNILTRAQWKVLEQAGAVFLPFNGLSIWYWSATASNNSSAYDMYGDAFGRSYKEPVRLVQEPGEDFTPVYTSFSETACDNYTWNGVKYTISGDYEQTFVTEQGCDSIVTLHLTINKSYETGFGEQAETSYTWEGTTYTESGDYTKTLQTVAGCDSIVTLHLTIGSDEPEDPIEYNLRVCGTRVTSANCADIAAAVDGVTGAVSYDPATNILTLDNSTLTTPDVTQAIWNQIPELKIIVKGECDLNTPYCIALRIDANTTIEGFNANASLKVRNAGPLDHAIGSVAAGTCYTALATFNNANLIVKDCEVETEGAGGLFLQGSSQLTVNHARLTALSIGTPTSDAQWNVMHSFKANVEPVLIDCELLEPEGVTFSSTLGGYTTDGSSLTREKVIIGYNEPCTDKTSEFSETAEGSYTWNGTVYDESGDYIQTFPMANGCDSIVTLHLTITDAAPDCMSIETLVDEQPADDVTFCPLTVLYANNKSTWVVDETGKAVQIYDNNKSYFDGTDTKGTVLNGVRGHYSAYRGQAEIIPVAAPESKTTTALIPAPERIKESDVDVVMLDENFPYWYQRYVELHNATVILNNSKYYAWSNDIQVYNPYQFALTEGEGKNLIGVLTKFNDQVQLYLLEDAKDYDPIQDVTTWTVVTTNEINWHSSVMPYANYGPCPAMDMTQVSNGVYQLQTYCSYISMANTAYSYPYWVVGDYNENIYRYPDLSQEFQYINAAEIGIGLYNFTFTFDTNGPRLTLDWTPSTVFTVEGTSNWLDSEFDPTDTNNDMQCEPTGAWWQKFTQSENTDIETLFGAPAEDLYVLLKENVRLESWVTYHFNFVGYHDRAIWQLDYNPMEGGELGVTEDGNYNVLFYLIPKNMYGYVIVEPARSNGLSAPSAVVLRPRKVIEDNSVIIIMPDGRRYNVLGTQVKQ